MMVPIVLSGRLDDAEMLFIGLNAAISVRVSNELGFGWSHAAKDAVAVVVA